MCFSGEIKENSRRVKEKARNREEKEENLLQVAQNQGVSLKLGKLAQKLKSSRLSETLAAFLAQASLISLKRDFVKKPRCSFQFLPKKEHGRPSETFLQPEELYLT